MPALREQEVPSPNAPTPACSSSELQRALERVKLGGREVGMHTPGPQPRVPPVSEAVGSGGHHGDPQPHFTQVHPYFKRLVVRLLRAGSGPVKYSVTLPWLGAALGAELCQLCWSHIGGGIAIGLW